MPGGPRSKEHDEGQPLLPDVFPRASTRPAADLEAGGGGQPPAVRRRSFQRYGTMLGDPAASSPGDNVEGGSSPETKPGAKRRDKRLAFIDGLLSCPELADRRIDRDSLAKGRAKLMEVLEGRKMTGGVLEALPNIIIFKGRPLCCACVLHLAVWCSAQLKDASLLDLIFQQPDYEHETYYYARYQLPSRRQGWTVELRLDALHIACGLGCLPAVETLIRNAVASGGGLLGTPCGLKGNKTSQDYVNAFTMKIYQKTDDPSQTDSETFYMPIHEATAQGFIDVAAFLLDCGAEGGVPNSDGVAPLHFLAMQGSAGGIQCCMAGSEAAMVRKLVTSLQEAGGLLETSISEKHYNPKWAGKTPLELAAADDSRFPRHMMGLLVPCLQDDGVAEPRFFADVAFLTALDGDAATNVVREIESQAGRNSTVLQRFRLDAQLKGRTDLIAGILFLAPEAGGAMLDMLVGDPIVADKSKHNIPTRTSLYGFWSHLPMRCIYRHDTVSRENVLLPAWKFETDRAFEKQPDIQWHKWLVPETEGLAKRTDYVYNVYVSTVLLPNILDLDMFMALSRVPRNQMKVFSRVPVQGMIYCLWNNLVERVWLSDLLFQLLELFTLMWWSLAWPVYGPRGTITADKPFCWSIIAAGVLREVVHIVKALIACFQKFRGHDDATMKSLWHPFSNLFINWAGPKVACLAAQAMFCWGSRIHLDDSELEADDQVFLALTVLIKATQVTYMFRLCAGGKKIYAIFYSFLGGATREMISITAMIFASFSLAFLVLAKDKAAGWVIASSYRGLLFGDGDGFNNLGMDVDEGNYKNNDGVLMTFLVIGSFFFNIIVLNLIIAVYGNEYDKVAGETPLLFLHGRAASCVSFILSCELFPWLGDWFNLVLRALSGLLAIAGLALHMSRTESTWELSTVILFLLAQILLQGAQAQADWFSMEGLAADSQDHFLWMCHRDAVEEDGANEALQVGVFEDRLAAVQRHVDQRIGSLEDKLDAILERLGDRD